MRLFIILTFLVCLCAGVQAWHADDLEIFDLVEEINKNFYHFMGIEHNATSQEIKRAFRSLSVVLHPDKNPSEDANVEFRNLVSIYEVLKDKSKREKYDKVLKDGLPNWKSALYYYRRMRKIGFYESMLIVFIFTTIGQYLFAWAAYLEKKTIFGSKLKKLQKKNKSIDMDTILSDLPIPSIMNTLPVQIPLAIYNLPWTIRNVYYKVLELRRLAAAKHLKMLEAAKEQERIEQELEEQTRQRKAYKENMRKRKQNAMAPEKTEDELRGYTKIHNVITNGESVILPAAQKATVSGGFWSDEDLTELVRLVKKFPSGKGNRWATIAETMNRSIHEVTFMAAKLKERGYRLPEQQRDSIPENPVAAAAAESQTMAQELIKNKKKKRQNQETTDAAPATETTNWQQEQQRALESALAKYLKTTTDDRWQKIANSVPGKSKEECKRRFKYICDLVKAQKSNDLELTETTAAPTAAAAAPANATECNESAQIVKSTCNSGQQEQQEQQQQEESETTYSKQDDNDSQPVNVKKLSKRELRRLRRDLNDDDSVGFEDL